MRMGGGQPDKHAESPRARELVLRALDSPGIELANPRQPGRYILVAKVDDDSLSDRRASYHQSEAAARTAIRALPQGWWPDCLIDSKRRFDSPSVKPPREMAASAIPTHSTRTT